MTKISFEWEEKEKEDKKDGEDFENLFILDHPLIQHKLSRMRSRDTPSPEFRRLMKEIAQLMGYEVTRHLPTASRTIETPLCSTEAQMVDEDGVVIVPILRAGLGMAEGLLRLIPFAREGHIGLYRDPATKHPVEYLKKLPPAAHRIFILVDPMLATGNSAAYAMDILNQHGVPDDRILFLALVAAPEGVAVLQGSHPDVPIYVAALDEKLNEKAYIVPGLGDAGDRIYGTE